MSAESCRCSACQRLALAFDDHAVALAFADDAALCRVSRTTVRLVSMVVDVRHGLGGVGQLTARYAEDAAGGDLLPLTDPISIGRAFVRSTNVGVGGIANPCNVAKSGTALAGISRVERATPSGHGHER